MGEEMRFSNEGPFLREGQVAAIGDLLAAHVDILAVHSSVLLSTISRRDINIKGMLDCRQYAVWCKNVRILDY